MTKSPAKKQVKIYVEEPIQFFTADGTKLVHAGFIDTGSSFTVGKAQMMVFDHHDQPAVPFLKGGVEYFALVKQLAPDQQRLILDPVLKVVA